jgi:hypothetical protein
METTIDLNKYKSCENGVPIRHLRVAKSSVLNLIFIKGEVWYLAIGKWCEAGWAKNGKLMGLYNGVFCDCNVKGYDLSVAVPILKPEPISKFKPMLKTKESKKLGQKGEAGQLNLFS